jgi:hypothetical protein
MLNSKEPITSSGCSEEAMTDLVKKQKKRWSRKGIMFVNQQKDGRWAISRNFNKVTGRYRCLFTERLKPGEEPMFETAEEFIQWYFDASGRSIGLRNNYVITVIEYNSSREVFKMGEGEYITIDCKRTNGTLTMPLEYYDKWYKEYQQ